MRWLSEYSNSIPGEYMLVPPAIDISMESGEARAEASHVFISPTYLAILLTVEMPSENPP